MKRSEINSKLIQVRAVLINLERRMEKVKGIDLSKVMLEKALGTDRAAYLGGNTRA